MCPELACAAVLDIRSTRHMLIEAAHGPTEVAESSAPQYDGYFRNFRAGREFRDRLDC